MKGIADRRAAVRRRAGPGVGSSVATRPPVRAALVLVVSLAIVSAACAASEDPATRALPASTSSTAAVGTAPLLGGTPMRACSSAGIDAWCGRLPVPEDRSRPGGRTIELRVTVVPALSASPEPDPVFFLAGGPGGAATVGWADAPSLFPEIHADRDIVLVDQRGTGGSNQLLLPELPDWSRLSMAELRAVAPPWIDDAFGALPGDYRHYTSMAAAADLDAVRSALGYEEINLYGGSYGATLAQYHLRQYPEHTRTAVLDGGTLVDVPLFERYAVHSQAALERVVARCRADDVCAAAYPDPAADLARAMRRLGARPVTTALTGTDGQPIVVDDVALAKQVHRLILMHRSGEVPRLVHLAARGQVRPVAELMAEPGGGDPQRLAMFWSILCTEAWASFRPGATSRHAAGSYLADAVIADSRSVSFACSRLKPGDAPAGDAEPVRTDVPVLLLNGSEDPQDPPANVADAAREMPNSLLVVAPGQGHTVGHLGCLPDLVAAFVASGSVEGLDTACVDTLSPPPFAIGSR